MTRLSQVEVERWSNSSSCFVHHFYRWTRTARSYGHHDEVESNKNWKLVQNVQFPCTLLSHLDPRCTVIWSLWRGWVICKLKVGWRHPAALYTSFTDGVTLDGHIVTMKMCYDFKLFYNADALRYHVNWSCYIVRIKHHIIFLSASKNW